MIQNNRDFGPLRRGQISRFAPAPPNLTNTRNRDFTKGCPMSIFHRALDRLAAFIWTGRKVNLRFTAEYRTACYAIPIINKLLAEREAGDTYRPALISWHEAERPRSAAHTSKLQSLMRNAYALLCL